MKIAAVVCNDLKSFDRWRKYKGLIVENRSRNIFKDNEGLFYVPVIKKIQAVGVRFHSMIDETFYDSKMSSHRVQELDDIKELITNKIKYQTITKMRKFKLIKEYPGSPELGTIGEERGAMYIAYKLPRKEGSIFETEVNLHRTQVLEFPEYWKEIKDEDYEILSFYYEDKLVLCIGGDDEIDKYRQGGERADVQIQSVKRLSDGQVISIGDWAYPESAKYNVGKITKIWFCDPGYIRFDGAISNSNKFCIGIKDLVIKEAPVFVTNDGVPKYRGQRFYYFAEGSMHMGTSKVNRWTPHISFHEFEEAQKYILMNSDILTLNDVFKALPSLRTMDKEKLTKLVKRRLS